MPATTEQLIIEGIIGLFGLVLSARVLIHIWHIKKGMAEEYYELMYGAEESEHDENTSNNTPDV